MPVKSCSSGGKSGHKWGDEGHCYTGPGSRAKAIKQGQAIQANAEAFAAELTTEELDIAMGMREIPMKYRIVCAFLRKRVDKSA